MKRFLLPYALSISAGALAQLTPFEIGAGYAQSGSFDKDTGGRGRIEGLSLSLSQSVLRLPLAGEVRLGASGILNGSDGSLVRVFGRYRSPSGGPNGGYGILGVWWARAEGKDGAFDTKDGTGVDVGIGLPLGGVLPGLPSVSLELISHQGNVAQPRGWSAVASFRL